MAHDQHHDNAICDRAHCNYLQVSRVQCISLPEMIRFMSEWILLCIMFPVGLQGSWCAKMSDGIHPRVFKTEDDRQGYVCVR